MTTAVPATIARGKMRCGSRVSPAEKVTYCHPSYAQSTAIMAAPTPERSENAPGAPAAAGAATGAAEPRPTAISTTAIPASATSFTPVVQFWTCALCRTPRTLIAMITRIIKARRPWR